MKRVLLAEDDEANRRMLKRVLESRDFHVTDVESGLEVLRVLEESRDRGPRFDAVVLDWMMPMLSGIEALPEMRKIEPDIHIVMLTARSGRDDMLGAFELGADDYVTKPFDFDVLVARLDARLRVAGARPERPSDSPEPDVGVIVDGRYRLTEQIGSGAFGVVFRARHLALESDVAIKFVKASAASAKALPDGPIDSQGRRVPKNKKKNDSDRADDFRREGARACRVRHENAVRIFDFGVHPSGRAYLVMELLRGRTLDEELRANQRLPLRRAIEVMVPVLDCLAAAHAQSVVHRDIKPANLFLHQGPAGEVVKVLDFGVAKLLDRDAAATRDSVPGSPSYMAPERLRGQKYDGRSDVYAVGITLYELLTGDVPFRTETGDIYAVVLQHLNDDAVPPSSLVPGLPVAVDDVMRAMLAKNPEARPNALAARAMLTSLIVADDASLDVALALKLDVQLEIDAPATTREPPAEPKAKTSSDVALVVDDDVATRHLIARALQQNGIEVASFDTGEAALASLTLVKPTFALLDVGLPGMSGFQLARHIAADDELRSTPILLTSAAGGSLSEAHEREAMELGGFFLAKPFRLSVFKEAIRELRDEARRRKSERRKPRVLIVDDDDGIRNELRNIVGEEGYEAVCAADAFEALSLCGATARVPDVAIIDIMMPGLDGEGLAARMRATTHLRSVPIVMISASDMLSAHAARIGAAASLKKPFELASFIEVLRRTVGEPFVGAVK